MVIRVVVVGVVGLWSSESSGSSVVLIVYRSSSPSFFAVSGVSSLFPLPRPDLKDSHAEQRSSKKPIDNDRS